MDKVLKNLERYQQALNEVFERNGVVLAYLYGSQARGDAGPLSDVDVAVRFSPDVPQDERFHRLLRLIGELGSVLRRDDVYVVDLAEASPLLRHHVYRDGQPLYCPDDAQRVRFETTALRDYQDYRQAIEGLGKVGVLPRGSAERLAPLAGFRNILVHDYLVVDPTKVYDLLIQGRADLREFGRQISEYLRSAAQT